MTVTPTGESPAAAGESGRREEASGGLSPGMSSIRIARGGSSSSSMDGAERVLFLFFSFFFPEPKVYFI